MMDDEDDNWDLGPIRSSITGLPHDRIGIPIPLRPRSILTRNSNESSWTTGSALSIILGTLKSMVPGVSASAIESCSGVSISQYKPRSSSRRKVDGKEQKELPTEFLKNVLTLLKGTQDLQTCRLVCMKWKTLIDDEFLRFQRILSRSSVVYLQGWDLTPLAKIIVCDIVEIDSADLASLKFLPTVKELMFESTRPDDYETSNNFQNPTVGEENLIEILKNCPQLHTLVFNNGSLGNFGLEVKKVDKNETSSHISVGWQWPSSGAVASKVNAVSDFLNKILGDLDDTLDALNADDDDDEILDSTYMVNVIPSDPPTFAKTDVTYEEPNPPFDAFNSLKAVHLELVSRLEITTCPTRNTEKMALIAILHTLVFPSLQNFFLHVKEYVPDEALYRSVFKFIGKHEISLRFLTLINPILCTKLRKGTAPTHIPQGLEKVKLRSLEVAWEMPIGLDIYWPNGHFLLENQRKLSNLELHSSSVVQVETVVCNNFRYLNKAVIDISDTWDTEFDCSCFSLCAQLKTLMIHVALTVRMKNVSKLPDTIQVLHWDALYTREDIRWFSKFLILAKSIFLYHDKDVPMDIFVPFTLGDLMQFLRLPCLEKLYLPRIHFQDPRVPRFCKNYQPGMGLSQNRDLFIIDRSKFILKPNTVE